MLEFRNRTIVLLIAAFFSLVIVDCRAQERFPQDGRLERDRFRQDPLPGPSFDRNSFEGLNRDRGQRLGNQEPNQGEFLRRNEFQNPRPENGVTRPFNSEQRLEQRISDDRRPFGPQNLRPEQESNRLREFSPRPESFQDQRPRPFEDQRQRPFEEPRNRPQGEGARNRPFDDRRDRPQDRPFIGPRENSPNDNNRLDSQNLIKSDRRIKLDPFPEATDSGVLAGILRAANRREQDPVPVDFPSNFPNTEPTTFIYRDQNFTQEMFLVYSPSEKAIYQISKVSVTPQGALADQGPGPFENFDDEGRSFGGYGGGEFGTSGGYGGGGFGGGYGGEYGVPRRPVTPRPFTTTTVRSRPLFDDDDRRPPPPPGPPPFDVINPREREPTTTPAPRTTEPPPRGPPPRRFFSVRLVVEGTPLFRRPNGPDNRRPNNDRRPSDRGNDRQPNNDRQRDNDRRRPKPRR